MSSGCPYARLSSAEMAEGRRPGIDEGIDDTFRICRASLWISPSHDQTTMERGARNSLLKRATALTPAQTHTKVQWTRSLMASHIVVPWTEVDKDHRSERHSPWILLWQEPTPLQVLMNICGSA